MAKQPTNARGKIVLAVGLPGSGKSTYFSRHGIQPLSSDTLRLWLLDDERDQSAQGTVFRTLRSLLRDRLILGRKRNYVDATNLTAKERKPYVKLGKQFGFDLEAIYFDVPLETCLARNRRRGRPVPNDAMRRMSRKLSPPTLAEGFSKIRVVNAGLKRKAKSRR